MNKSFIEPTIPQLVCDTCIN